MSQRRAVDSLDRMTDSLDRMTSVMDVNSQRITGLLESQAEISKQKLSSYNSRNAAQVTQLALKSLALLFDQGIIGKDEYTEKAKKIVKDL